MKKILLCPNQNKKKSAELTKSVYDRLISLGASPVVCPLFEDEDCTGIGGGMECKSLETALDDADLIIAFGGDGTLLRAARAATHSGVPILGVNLGTLGFMAEIEPDSLHLIDKVVAGEYTVEKRMMLDVSVERNGETVFFDYALNDIVVGGIARIIDLTVYSDGREMTKYKGDGVIVATPTGSTAYSMSAGGPIVEPTAENIIITPSNAHVMLAKSFVLAPQRKVTVELGRLRSRRAYTAADGRRSFDLMSGDKVHIKRSNYETKLVRVTDMSFYELVGKKMGDKK